MVWGHFDFRSDSNSGQNSKKNLLTLLPSCFIGNSGRIQFNAPDRSGRPDKQDLIIGHPKGAVRVYFGCKNLSQHLAHGIEHLYPVSCWDI